MDHDVLIIGDGIVAKAAHLALMGMGLSAARIAMPAPEYANDPRVYAISPSSFHVFDHLELDLARDEAVKAIELGFGDALQAPLARLETGEAMMYMLSHSEIARAMDAKLPAAIAPTGRVEITEFFAQYSGQRGKLLLLCEGKHGEIATRLGINYQRHDYHARAITAKFRGEIPHQACARQLFTPEGPIGILPHGRNEFSIVWSAKATFAEHLLALEEAEFTAALEARIGAFYGALSLTQARASFPLVHKTPTRLTGERFALMGDSAHAIHPLAGQGLNLGLRDVAVMADALFKAKSRGEDLGNAGLLDDYKARRKGDIARLTHLTRGIDDFLVGTNALPNIARKLAQKALSSHRLNKLLALQSDFALDPMPPLLLP